MSATLAQSRVVVVERTEPADEPRAGDRPRGSAETEADKIRRQQRVRLKTKLARRALAAHRSR